MAFAGLVGEGDAGPGPVAERERNHLDLVLRLPGLRLIVVENKVWSLPDDTQLARYASGPVARLGGDVAPILLSLSPPVWDSRNRTLGGYTWVHLGYRDLAGRLGPVADRLSGARGSDDGFAGELLYRYVRYVERLCSLADRVVVSRPSRCG